jgi:hypothetical protein
VAWQVVVLPFGTLRPVVANPICQLGGFPVDRIAGGFDFAHRRRMGTTTTRSMAGNLSTLAVFHVFDGKSSVGFAAAPRGLLGGADRSG